MNLCAAPTSETTTTCTIRIASKSDSSSVSAICMTMDFLLRDDKSQHIFLWVNKLFEFYLWRRRSKIHNFSLFSPLFPPWHYNKLWSRTHHSKRFCKETNNFSLLCSVANCKYIVLKNQDFFRHSDFTWNQFWRQYIQVQKM